ncbi:MAG: response regulator receiver protein [Acidobacteriales bacterium]|nr:response regulator receiver protein [Terriglobales bacterium]
MSNVYTILLVDDEINVARTLQMVFEAEGYVVSVAYSAKQALAMFTGGFRADIVITDLNMEKDDIGLDVARAAQELSPRPIVVICTGYANVENSTLALEMRVDYLVTKPVDLDDLKSALLTMLARRGNRRAKVTKRMGANANG